MKGMLKNVEQAVVLLNELYKQATNEEGKINADLAVPLLTALRAAEKARDCLKKKFNHTFI